MSDNDFPAPPKLPILTLKDIIRKYPRELWAAEPNDEGYVKQAPDWILTEAAEALSHIDSTEDRNEFVYESLGILGDWGEFSSLLLRHCKENPESELAQFWDKWSKHRVQDLIELAEEDFTVSQAYKECQEDWQSNEYDVVALDDYRNRRGE